MKQISILTLVPFIAVLAFAACTEQDGSETVSATATEEQSGEGAAESAAGPADDAFYAVGYAISKNLDEFHLTDSELEQVKRGLDDGVKGREPKVDLDAASQRIQELARERSQKAAETERAEGESFLAEAAAADGAQTTESGLIVQTIEEGTGPIPAPTDTVEVNYRGTLRDGTEFDSSYERGQPVTFPLNQVIPCWSEGVQRMKVGGKAKLVCPPDLAYGDRANGPIPAGSTLIFEVELLDILEGNPSS